MFGSEKIETPGAFKIKKTSWNINMNIPGSELQMLGSSNGLLLLVNGN